MTHTCIVQVLGWTRASQLGNSLPTALQSPRQIWDCVSAAEHTLSVRSTCHCEVEPHQGVCPHVAPTPYHNVQHRHCTCPCWGHLAGRPKCAGRPMSTRLLERMLPSACPQGCTCSNTVSRRTGYITGNHCLLCVCWSCWTHSWIAAGLQLLEWLLCCWKFRLCHRQV